MDRKFCISDFVYGKRSVRITNKKEDLLDIIKNERIYPVFQPIVNLKTGEILGFEGLSRIINPRKIDNVEDLFVMGVLCGKTWELEKLCRKKIFRSYAKMSNGLGCEKLFINVNPLVMQDEDFKANFTRKQLKKRGIDTEKIVIEVTERNSISNVDEFTATVCHYKEEGYQIAIDDLGSCYSGLNVVCDTHPHYLKIDMKLVRNISSDYMRQALIKGLVELAANSDIRLIAEGIETEDELNTLLLLGVDYGQGYLLGRPSRDIEGYLK